MIDLSVLICSTHTRWQTFGQRIQEQVWTQYNALPKELQDRVEILMLTDNKAMMLGHKRNVMVDAAQGRYVVFVDDDDRIDPEYLATLINATDEDDDVITFMASVTINGGNPKVCRYSIAFREDRNTPRMYERLPNHICAVKRELAQRASFPNVAYGEDSGYSKILKPLLKTEFYIPRVLYHYDYSSATTEAQEHRRAPVRQRKQPPVVDVVILSNAEDKATRQMTQTAIDTCIAGANSLPVNVIVLEQGPGMIYKHADVTVPMMGEFNYNRFANLGAGMGKAEWIMIANNDLVFHDGWLHALLAADHPFVSPKCPRDRRQKSITENETGIITGRHMSGWCFMITRDLWERIDGFDTDVTFWASDDATIEQVVKAGVMPMLVPSSRVEHIQSVTLKKQDRATHDQMTWGSLHTFIEKYGSHRMQGHPDYLRWKHQHGKA